MSQKFNQEGFLYNLTLSLAINLLSQSSDLTLSLAISLLSQSSRAARQYTIN